MRDGESGARDREAKLNKIYRRKNKNKGETLQRHNKNSHMKHERKRDRMESLYFLFIVSFILVRGLRVRGCMRMKLKRVMGERKRHRLNNRKGQRVRRTRGQKEEREEAGGESCCSSPDVFSAVLSSSSSSSLTSSTTAAGKVVGRRSNCTLFPSSRPSVACSTSTGDNNKQTAHK